MPPTAKHPTTYISPFSVSSTARRGKLLALVLGSLLLAGCERPSPPPPPPRPALVKIITEAAPEQTLALIGEVRPRYESSQGFRIDGKIIERRVDVGAQVQHGQVLARLDTVDMGLAAAAAQADVRAAEAAYALAQSEWQRQQQLFAKRFISASALDNYAATFKAASARLAQVKAQANVALNQNRYTSLTADRDGIVTWVRAEPGQVVKAGETIVQIADIRALEVLAAVPESRMAGIVLQAPVTIKLWADRQKPYLGHVREIAPTADSATRAFNVRIAFKAADAAVKLGMTAVLSFNGQAQPSSRGLLIPSAALTEIDGQKTVWVIDAQNSAQPHTVEAGPFSEDGIAVYHGLQAGERIAIAGVHTLVKGQVVTPVTAATP